MMRGIALVRNKKDSFNELEEVEIDFDSLDDEFSDIDNKVDNDMSEIEFVDEGLAVENAEEYFDDHVDYFYDDEFAETGTVVIADDSPDANIAKEEDLKSNDSVEETAEKQEIKSESESDDANSDEINADENDENDLELVDDSEELQGYIEIDDEDEDDSDKASPIGVMERIMIALAACVVIALVVVGGLILIKKPFGNNSGNVNENGIVYNPELGGVGSQLAGIDVIGGDGIQAAIDAKMDSETAVVEVVVDDQDDDEEFQENDYNSEVEIAFETVSVVKDLKIKIVNKSTGKLIANVPFVVTVTTPSGTIQTWTDTDKDGILYYSDIESGTYKLHLEALDTTKYAGYIMPADAKPDVKDEIVYEKVEVADEILTAEEVNEATEDTVREGADSGTSTLTNTVAWVDSSKIDTYTAFTDTAAINMPFSLTSVNYGDSIIVVTEGEGGADPQGSETGDGEGGDSGSGDTGSGETGSGDSGTGSGSGSGDTGSGDSGAGSDSGSGETGSGDSGSGSGSGSGDAGSGDSGSGSGSGSGDTGSGNSDGGQTTPVTGDISCDASVSVKVNETKDITVTVNVTGTTSSTVSATVDGSAATASYSNGKLTVKGVSVGTATVKLTLKDGDTILKEKSVTVTVSANAGTITLSKNSLGVLNSKTASVQVTLTDLTSSDVTVTSSDSSIATATLGTDGKLTVTGKAAGTANIVLTQTSMSSVTVTLAVTVYPGTEKLTATVNGKAVQLYVKDSNGNYREACYSDCSTTMPTFYTVSSVYTGWQTIDGKQYYYTSDNKVVTGEQVINGVLYNFDSTGALVVGNGTLGIDVSKWNGDINWSKVKAAGVSYVIIRIGYRGSTLGGLIDDANFKKNIEGAQAAGLKIGVYFVTQAINDAEAVYEASMVLDRIAPYTISYPVFLDVESSGGRGDQIDVATRTSVCKTFCKTIQNAGYTAGIYANKSWLTNKIDASQLTSYKIWVAQYYTSCTYSGSYSMWQYTDSGTIDGINGKVDLNKSYLGY